MLPVLEKLQRKQGRNYFVKVLVQDKSSRWVDVSDRCHRVKDRIVGLPKIKINTDSKSLSYKFYASSGEMTVSNEDGFWDSIPPFTLKTIDGYTANFDYTKSKSELVWSGRKIQFRLYEQYQDIYREKSLGTFLIDDIETSLGETASIKIVDLSEPLRQRDASVVKNGMSWYQNRSISFLVKKLLELEYGTETGGMLPSTFDIDARIDLETFDGERTLSTIGPPPQETDTDNDGISNIFYEKIKSARCSCIAPSTISTDTKSSAKNTLYFGCDEQIFSYNPSNDLYGELTSSSTLGTGYYIRYLWFNSVEGAIYGIAYADMPQTAISAGTLYGWMSVTAKVFKYTTSVGLSVLGSISNFYDGKYIYHDSACFTSSLGTGEGIPSVDGLGCGLWGSSGEFTPNIYFNYRQFIRYYSQLDNRKVVKVEHADDKVLNADIELSIEELPCYVDGFCGLYGYSSADDYTDGYFDTKYRTSFGQQGGVSFLDSSIGLYTQGAILFATVGNAGDRYTRYSIDLKVINISLLNTVGITTATSTIDENIIVPFGTTSVPGVPISACARKFSTSPGSGFYVGTHGWALEVYPRSGEAVNYNSMSSEIRFYNLSTLAWTTILSYDSTKIPIEIYYDNGELTSSTGDDSSGLYVVLLDRAFILTSGSEPLYSLYRYDKLGMGLAQIITTSMNQPKGIIKEQSSTQNNLWFVSQQAGYLAKYNFTTNILSMVDEGFPITDNNFFLYSQLMLDEETRSDETIVWGISSSYFDYQLTNASGISFYLFKFDKVLSEYVSLADFEGINIWDALGLLAQRANCSMGFDEDGNFFFKKRTLDANSSYTLNVDNGDIYTIKKDRGKDEIFNYIEITPYNSLFKEPEYKAYLQIRDADEDVDTVGDDELVLKQTDTITKKIDLICVVDGDANIAKSTSGFPMFKFCAYEPVITGRFDRAHTAQTILYCASIFGGEDTDFGIKPGYYLLYTDSSDDEHYYEILSVSTSNNTIVIDTAITTERNDEFKVYKKGKISNSSSISKKLWSDEGVTFITADYLVETTEHYVNSTDNLSKNTVVLIGNKFVRITAIEESEKKISVSPATTASIGDIVKAYYAPYNNTEFFEIGRTRVFIQISSATANKAIFKQGDRITIDCPGLVLESDEASKQVAVNTQSISKYGKRQYPNINNRFLTRKLAKQLAQWIRTEYAFPKYNFSITMPLSNFLDVVGTANLTKVTIRSQKLLPYRSGYQEDCRICSIEHDIGRGVTTLELKSDSFY